MKFLLHHNSESCRSSTRVTRFKRGQGTCCFNSCDEEGISPGSPDIQMTSAEIPFSKQLLKIQEPCPPFQMVSLCRSPALFKSGHSSRAPAALSVVMKRGFHQQLHERVTIWKGGQGSCSFNSCIEKGTSAGLICIYGEPGEIPSSSPQLKLQEPCPLLKSGHSSRAPAVLNVVMKREFHQGLHRLTI